MMNGSFEAASYLERAIRAGLEDQSDSSLSAPGLGRRAKSASLSFATDEGSDDGHTQNSYQHPSTNRVLDHLSEYDSGAFAGRTPTARRMVTATQNFTKQTQQQAASAPSVPLGASQYSQRKLNTATNYKDDDDEDSQEESMVPTSKAVADSRSSSLSSSESGIRRTGRDATRASAPLNSTPQRTNITQRSRDATSFYSQRSHGEPSTGRFNLVRRAAETGARDATTQSQARSKADQRGSTRDDDSGSVSLDSLEQEDRTGQSELAPHERELSINTIEEATSFDDDKPHHLGETQTEHRSSAFRSNLADHDDEDSFQQPSEADSHGQTSQMHTSDIRPVHSTQTQREHTAEGDEDVTGDSHPLAESSDRHDTPRFPANDAAVNDTTNATVEVSHDSAPETSPSAARAARQTYPSSQALPSNTRNQSPLGVATPRPQQAGKQRMQAYLLSVVKDPAREEKIQRSVKRMRAQRVPIEQIQSEESSLNDSVAQTPHSRGSTPLSGSGAATPAHRMDRLGRPMTIGAGRTPLPPFRPSGLANQYSADDSRSIASDQSSVHDLVGPSRWENRSEPGTVAREGKVIDAGLRVDSSKLDRHLHRVNAELSKENDRLAEENTAKQNEVENLRRQLNTALREKEMLARQSQGQQGLSPANIPLPPSPVPGSAPGASHTVRGNLSDTEALTAAKEKILELEGHKEQLNDMLDELEEQFLQIQAENEELQQAKHSSRHLTKDREDHTGEDGEDAGEVKAQLEEAIRELDQLDQDYQAKEQECQQLRDMFNEAKEFALQECQKAEEERDVAKEKAAKLDKEAQILKEQITGLNRSLERMRSEKIQQSDDQALSEENEQLRDEVAQLQAQLTAAKKELESAQEEHDNIRDELETALEGNELQLQDLEREKALVDEDLRQAVQKAEDLKDQLDRQKIAVSEKQTEILKLTRQTNGDVASAERVAELEVALDTARRDASLSKDRLAGMISKSEHETELKMKKEEIELLQKQKKEVERRLDEYKQQALNLSLSLGGGGGANSSLKTPAKGVHKSLLHLRTPIRTPQTPGHLSSASWLNDSTIGNESAIMHIQELQRLLDEANAKIDEKLSEIDRQGLSHLTLTRRLLEAHERIEQLEAELERILGEGGELHIIDRRLKSIRCNSCSTKFDASKQVRVKSSLDRGEDEDGAADETVTSSRHQASVKGRGLAKSVRSRQRDEAFAEFVDKMTILTTRLAEAEGENRKLREANARGGGKKPSDSTKKDNMRSDTRSKDVAKDLQAATHTEIEKARAAIVELDSELQEERKRLPELARDSKTFGDLTSSAERDLARSELRLRSIEAELRRKAEDHNQLYRELLEKSSVGSDVPLQLQVLQAQVRQTGMDLEHLREDRNAILEAREELHDKFRHASEKYLLIQTELTTCRETVTSHAAQLDQQTKKMERLHATLKDQHRDIQRVTGERDRLYLQREEIIKDVSALENDLRRVRIESEAFGRDLERLRIERDEQKRRAEVARETSISITAEAQDTINSLKERLDEARRMIQQIELTTPHVGQEEDVINLKLKHEQECKGLLLHTRYLKTKFMRESDLRSDLAFQKSYLLQILGGLELSEKETIKFLSDLEKSRHVESGKGKGKGKMVASSDRSLPRNKLRRVAQAVLAMTRMSLMAQRWRQSKEVKRALLEAYEVAKLARNGKTVEDGRAAVNQRVEKVAHA